MENNFLNPMPPVRSSIFHLQIFFQRTSEHGGGREWRRAAHCRHEFELSREQRIVLHCVLRMKLFVARNSFAQSRKMLSMNELIEQNSQV